MNRVRLIGHYWVVWDKIVGDFISVGDKSNPRMIWVDSMRKLDVDVDKSWEKIRKEYGYPNKGSGHYPNGDIMFNEIKGRFTVTGPPKLTNDPSFQHRIIKTCGLNQWTIFIKE